MRDSLLSPTKTEPSVAELYASIREDLATAQAIFDAELASELSFVNALCDRIRSYRGKMLRPALLLLSAKATGGLNRDHHTLAAVVEMVHVATLVHDDVLDEANERRKQPTVRATNGNVAAVLLGDYLISHAYHLCSSLATPHAGRRIGAMTNTVCEGELIQNEHRGDDRIDEGIYLDIVRRKTGVLTAGCCELGARYADADAATIDALHAYGLATGIAFQIIDDVLDITGDPSKVGKTLGLDLMLGKLTLPTIHGLANASPTTASALRNMLAGRAPVDPVRLVECLQETDSVEYAVSVAAGYVADAVHQLEPLPPSEAKSALTAMAEFIINRRY